MDKEKIKCLLITGYKGAKLGLTQEELIEFVDNSIPYLTSHSKQNKLHIVI